MPVLSAIVVPGVTLAPPFAPNVTSYSASINGPLVTIAAATQAPGALITIAGQLTNPATLSLPDLSETYDVEVVAGSSRRYSLTFNRRLEQTAYLKPNAVVNSQQFGQAVSLSRDGTQVVVIGQRHVVEVFRRGGTTGATLTRSTPVTSFPPAQPLGFYDRAVAQANDGSRIVVGFADFADTTATENGRIAIYSRAPTGWLTEYEGDSVNAAGNLDEAYGISTAINGTGSRVAVGTDLDFVEILDRSGTTWSFTQRLTGLPNTKFGRVVALSDTGATLVVGSPFDPSPGTGINPPMGTGAPQSGAVHVFNRAATFTRSAFIKGSNTETNDSFGAAVALSADGRTLAVGAPGEDSGGSPANNTVQNAGAVYVFALGPSGWAEQAYLKAPMPVAFDSFGHAVSLSPDGTMLAVTAPLNDTGGTGIDPPLTAGAATSSGIVYVFRRAGTTWSLLHTLKASNVEAFDEFGASVSMGNDALVCGAPNEDSGATGINGAQADNSVSQAGAAYFFSW